MKNECNIINDLLALYNENLVREETRAFVDRHLEGCSECRDKLKDMQADGTISSPLSVAPLKGIKKRLLKKRLETVVLTAAWVLAILIAAFSFLTSPQYLPFSEEMLSISESENGRIILAFNDEVTGYNAESGLSEDGKTSIYHISAWNTMWEEYFAKHGKQNFFIEPIDGTKIEVYYSLNHAAEDLLIYGTKSYTDSGVMSLPRLVLGYYLIMATIACVVSAVLLCLYRKKPTVKIWIERVMIFPISYILGHLCIKGFSMETYSSGRDFSIILLISILFYLGGLLGINLYRAKKENQYDD